MADRLTSQLGVRRLALGLAVLAFAVAALGAWVRLTGAGLGCPDWPGCYGRMVVGPDGAGFGASVDTGKAWREMVHRYFAGVLGLGILLLAFLAVRSRRRSGGGSAALPVGLLLLVVFQAVLGAWTVSSRLQPVVVVAHLLGGLAILGGLWWAYLGPRPGGAALDPDGPDRRSQPPGRSSGLRVAVAAGIAVLAAQISLGGWTSANYAALACPDLPTCQGAWWPDADYAAGFRLWQESGSGFEGGVLDRRARTAIHLAHRLGAVVAVLYLALLCGAALRRARSGAGHPGLAAAASCVLGLVIVQAALGVSNVWLGLPLGVAVAHNAGAALVLLAMLAMHHRSG